MTERERIVRHVARCGFCRALLIYSQRRSDRALLDAADQLAWQHTANDAEHARFASAARGSSRTGRHGPQVA